MASKSEVIRPVGRDALRRQAAAQWWVLALDAAEPLAVKRVPFGRVRRR